MQIKNYMCCSVWFLRLNGSLRRYAKGKKRMLVPVVHITALGHNFAINDIDALLYVG